MPGPFTLVITLFVVAMGTGVVLSLRDGGRLPSRAPMWVAQMAQRAGGIILVLAATSLLAFMLRGFRQRSDRRPLAVMWDVLSFWPRRYHPLGVRPYSERAVPDIESRLKWHAGQGRRVIVAGHTQGSVLAYTTLLRLAVSDPDILPSVALVTYGSPLKNPYARFFPRYFSVEDFEGLRQRTGSPSGGEHAWRNFYRSTDYVGWTAFTDALASSDRRLPDPPDSPLIEAVPLGLALPAGTDPPPPPFTKLSIHSGYTSEPEIRAWIDAELVARLLGVMPG